MAARVLRFERLADSPAMTAPPVEDAYTETNGFAFTW